MIKKAFITCLLVSSFATVSVFAQDKKGGKRPDPEEMFKKLDTDGDGKLSKAEVDKSEHKMIKENFSEIDTDNDGYISKEEFKAFKPKKGPGKKD